MTRYQQRIAGLVILAAGCVLMGLGVAQRVGATPSESAATTIHSTHTDHEVKLVTVRVKGRVLSRHDHILVVLVPRTVFHTRTVPSRRIVVPRHVVRIHQPTPTFGATSAVIGVAPPPVTIYVPTTITVPVDVPGPTVTDIQTVTETAPPITVTITITVPILPQQ